MFSLLEKPEVNSERLIDEKEFLCSEYISDILSTSSSDKIKKSDFISKIRFFLFILPYRISFEVELEVLDFPDIEHFQMPRSDRKSLEGTTFR